SQCLSCGPNVETNICHTVSCGGCPRSSAQTVRFSGRMHWAASSTRGRLGESDVPKLGRNAFKIRAHGLQMPVGSRGKRALKMHALGIGGMNLMRKQN